MPFAGLEVALVALAFRVLGRHDADFERLEVGDHEVTVEARNAALHTRFVDAHREYVDLLGQAHRCFIGVQERGLAQMRVMARAVLGDVPLGREPAAPAEEAG